MKDKRACKDVAMLIFSVSFGGWPGVELRLQRPTACVPEVVFPPCRTLFGKII